MAALLTIGKVAREAGVSVDTIRYYERVGLLPKPARTPAGYRTYSPAVIHRLAVVRNAQRFGFPLKAIAGFLRVRDCDERFVIAVNIRDDYQFHLRVLQADSRQSSLSSHQLLVSSVIHIFN